MSTADHTADAATCQHSHLSVRSIDRRPDLGRVYINHRCGSCGEPITESYPLSGQQWYGSTGFGIDTPAAADTEGR